MASVKQCLKVFGGLFGGAGPSQTETAPTESKSPPPASLSVLVIDDDVDFLRSLRSLLRAEGFDVIAAESGVKGLQLLRYTDRQIAVVLLDYNMPQLNGAETLRHLRKLAPKAKVIAVTGVSLDQIPANFTEGVDRFIQKPFEQQQLISAIKESVAG